MLIVVLAGFLLIYFKSFFAPLSLAFLFALMLYPASKKLESWRVPRGLAIGSLLVGFLAIVAGVVFGISLAFRSFLQDIPALERQFQENLLALQNSIQGSALFGEQASASLTSQLRLSELIDGKVINTVIGTTTNILFVAAFTLIFTFFMLYYREKFVHFIHRIFEKRRHGRVHEIMDQLDDIAPRYLLGVITVVSILAVLNSAGFALIGVKSPIFMGIIAAILNVIPFIGTIFGFGVVFIFTLATQSIGTAIGVLIMFFVIQFLDNNILTPNITAAKIKLNPLFAILAILLGNAVWGVLGMFVALPFLAMLKIILDNTKRWQPVGELLGIVSPLANED